LFSGFVRKIDFFSGKGELVNQCEGIGGVGKPDPLEIFPLALGLTAGQGKKKISNTCPSRGGGSSGKCATLPLFLYRQLYSLFSSI